MIQCIDLGLRQHEALRRSGLDDPQFIEHAMACRDCSDALRAMRALENERRMSVARPRDGAYERAALTASSVAKRRTRVTGGFWAGLATGAAAAAVLIAVMLVVLPTGQEAEYRVPQVTLVLDQPEEVGIAIQATEPMKDAEIHVMLRGAVDLYGYEGQRDVHWTTDLYQGTNELKLPVVVSDSPGGELVVVVHHGGKRKSFQVEVIGRTAT